MMAKILPGFYPKYAEMIVSIINGQKPVSSYDEIVDYWYKNGGTEIEAAATKEYLK